MSSSPSRLKYRSWDAAGQLFRNIQLVLHKAPEDDDRLRGLIRKTRALASLDLFTHRLEVPLHAVHSNRQDVHKAQMLGVLGDHRREHASDNVAKRNAGTKITSASDALGAKRDNSGKLSNSHAVLSGPQLPDCAPATGCGLRWENPALPTPTLRSR
jgi:hypothetical protein